jgi:predicted Rossmann fold flavoprotein
LNWLPRCDQAGIAEEMQRCRRDQAARRIIRTPLFGMPGRLWQWLVHRSGIESETQWAALDRSRQHQLILQLCRTELKVIGKSMNKEEFVTCGGVRLSEVDFKSMQSRICPGLYFAGELLDIDGLTGGFNFQAAWTTGWIAGHAMSHYVSM